MIMTVNELPNDHVEKPEMLANALSDTAHSGEEGPVLSVLVDARHETRDLKLLNRAIRNRWDIPIERRAGIVNRLLQIVEKEQVIVMSKSGPCCLEEPADKNAILAARVLVGMEAQNQEDEFTEMRPRGTDTTINIGAIGNISMGQEPLTPSDAKLQAEEILRRVLERTMLPETARVEIEVAEFDLSNL